MPEFKRDLIIFFLTIFLLCNVFNSIVFGQVLVSGGAGGNALCVGSPYTNLTPIVITEQTSNDIDITPTGFINTIDIVTSDPAFEFEPNVGSFSFTGEGASNVLIAGTVTSSKISISILETNDNNATGVLNTITITGIRVKATSALLAQNLKRVSSGATELSINGFSAPSTITSAVLAGYAVPTVSAGSDAQVCQGISYNFSSQATLASSSNYSSLLWSHNGTGTILNGNSLTPTYNTGSTETGVVTFTLTAYGDGSCASIADNMTLTINAAPSISAQPLTSQELCVDGTANFSVTASGFGPLTYQWRKGGLAIGGANSSTYTISGVVPGNAGSDYDVVVSGTCTPSVTSAQSALVVNAIGIQPIASQSVCEGDVANFNVTISGTGLSYQWKKNGLSISGANSSSYSIPATGAADAGTYTLVIGGTCSPNLTSNGSVLTVNERPEITVQPLSNQTVCAGQGVTFNVNAGVTTNPTYQWRKGGSPIGANSASYTIANAAIGDAGSYDVVVGGTCTTPVTSSVASLTVNKLPTAFANPQTICSGLNSSVSISNPNSVSGTNFTWSIQNANNINGTAPGGGSVISQILSSTDGVNSGFVTYQITASAAGCTGPPFAVTITTLPIPNVGASDVTICSGSNSNVVITNPNGVSNTTFTWLVNSASNVTGHNNGNGPLINQILGSANGTSSGFVTYAITPRANGCSGVPLNVTVTVHPIATVNAGADFQVCEDQAVQLSGAYGGSASTVTWSGGSGASRFTNVNSTSSKYNLTPSDISNGTISLTLTTNDPDGTGPSGPCIAVSDMVVVKINKLPQPSIFGLSPTYAENDPPVAMAGFPFGGVFTGPGVQSGTNYFDPSIANFGNNIVKYSYTDPVTTCSNFTTQSVLVNELTTIDYSIDGQTDEDAFGQIYICNNTGRHLLIGVPGVSGGQAPTEFTSLTNGLVTRIGGNYYLETDGILSGVYQVTYTYTNASSATNMLVKNIIINPSPLAAVVTANACIVDNVAFTDGTTVPNNNTGAVLTNWEWDFGDNFQSTLQNTTHIYGAPGNYIVKLIATTDQACSNTATLPIRIGNPPKVDFGWSEICSGVSTKFVSKTSYGISGPKYFSWNFDDGVITPQGDSVAVIGSVTNTTGMYASPRHKYTAFKTYNVKLTVETNDGCVASATKKVYILEYSAPTQAGGYFENFENGSGTWVRTAASSDTSWIFGKPVGSIINKAKSGTNAWWTGANAGTYFNNEKSEVIGPCVNLNNIERPMVSLNYWSDAQDQFDGAAIQYSVDGGMSWVTIGSNKGDGIEWYKNSAIVSNPGNQPLGQYGWSGSSTGWRNGRFNLDEIPINNRSQVIFRIAFASNSDNPSGSNYNGFAFDDVYIGEKKRNVLIESFTNIPDAISSQYFDKLFVDQTTVFPEKKKSDFFRIQYHMANPNLDSINQANPVDPATRAFYYGVSQPPYSIMDGVLGDYFQTSFNGDYVRITAAELDRRALEDSPFEIQTTILAGSPSQLKANIKIKYVDSLNANTYPVIVHAALVEASIGSLRNVVRKLLLKSEGKSIAGPWSKGTIVDVPIDYTVDVHITNPDQLALVIFIQDKVNHKIYQSLVVPAPRLVGPQIVGIPDDTKTTEGQPMNVYPNPVNDVLNVEFNSTPGKTYTWQIIDQRGVTVLSGELQKDINTIRQVDLKGLPDGIYLVTIAHNGEILTRKKIAVLRNN